MGQSVDFRQVKTLQAAIARRDRLWVELRTAHPNFTQSQIEARLEQFGT